MVPYRIYPEPGGLLPWGSIRNGGYAFWLTGAGEPQGWPVVLASAKCGHWDRFDGTVCEFLTEVAAARYDASGFTAGAGGSAVGWVLCVARHERVASFIVSVAVTLTCRLTATPLCALRLSAHRLSWARAVSSQQVDEIGHQVSDILDSRGVPPASPGETLTGRLWQALVDDMRKSIAARVQDG